MIGRLTQLFALLATVLLLAPGLPAVSEVAAQDSSGRFRILVPDFFPQNDARRNFGRDAADELRDEMRTLARHTSIEKREIEDELKRFDMKMDQLDCLQTRQLGAQINAQLALCASYEALGDRQVRVSAEFWDLESSQSFALEPFVVSDRDDDEAAAEIIRQFETYAEQLQVRAFCYEYGQSQQWDDALRTCNQALDMNPDDLGVRQQLARIHFEQAKRDDDSFDHDLLEEALGQLEIVVENDPLNDNALNLAGYVATQLGRIEQGRQYYRQYLELNPGAISVRRTIAYDMYQAGDPEGALVFIEEGLESPGDTDVSGLLVDVGNYAFGAAAALARDTSMMSEDSEGVSPRVAGFYEKAIDAYMRAFAARGDSMSTSALRNVINAHIQLGQFDRAASTAEEILEVHPNEVGIWWAYATALQRQNRLDEALDALSRVESLDSNYPNLYAIQGRWLLSADRLDDAVRVLKRAATQGQDPNSMARLVFADAHRIGTQENNYNKGIRYLQAAKEFDVSRQQREELDFWHGYFLMQQARAQQEPQTVETARATLPKFQQAKQLFQNATGYGESRPGVNLSEMIQATNTFIEIQEAIIARAGRR